MKLPVMPAMHAETCGRRQGGVCGCHPTKVTSEELEKNLTVRQREAIEFLMNEIHRRDQFS